MRTHSSFLLAAVLTAGCSGAPEGDRAGGGDAGPLVVYCAHDEVYSRPLLEEFEQVTGIRVAVKMDTEATKSLGLVNLIVREAKAPRCDVFWNNELLGTADLAARGLLEPHKGAGYERIPDRYKDAEGRWCGFAARLRVWIVNTEQMKATPEAVEAAFRDRLADFTWAKPLFGTTLTHYCVLASTRGLDGLAEIDAAFRETATPAASNGQTRDLVAAGTCAFGWTDTDDYFGAVDSGKAVGMVPVRVEGDKTICIPNTVAIVKGTKRRDAAEKLVEFLLSKETELRLAKSESRQIPLGPVDEAELPNQVRDLVPLAAEGVDLSGAIAARPDVLRYLTKEYAN